ncbi:glycosyltransferase [Aestuariivivens sediminis]|uniref:glycosyltransferase n=1 Tax=Aestuariivivens sediminis TaxID=2913557 RepID=UPI001F59EF17
MASKKLLIIGFVWPEPKSSAAGSRMMQLIEAFKAGSYEITFASACVQTKQAFDLDSIGVSPIRITLNDSSFDLFVKTLNPDVVLFDRFMTEEQYGWRVAEQCPKALRILDTEDLHALRKGRQQALKDNHEFDRAYLFNNTAKREIASIYRSDLSLIISEIEMNLLKTEFKIDPDLLCYLPFMLETIKGAWINALPKFNERQDFISIGNFLHDPNYDAILFLKESIWPLIRKELPQAEMHVYGAYLSQKVKQLHNEKERFLIKGFTNDANHVMQRARVCLAPLRFGAGLKGKLIDAMQNGTPSVMTSIAAEGMFGKLKANGFIEDNSSMFAAKAIQLYTDEILWNEKQQFGFETINKRFSNVKYRQKVLQDVNKAIREIDIRRQHNFIGQLLQYQTLQSTKFMSKWIEEKNKN